jgi:hypothetical protein
MCGRIIRLSSVRIAGVLVVVAVAWACAAGAEDAIKPGEWEFSTLEPGVTHLPPGVQASPGMRLGPEGLTVSRTECISATNPFPPNAQMSAPPDANHPCKIDKTDVNGGTVRWSTTCATPQVTIKWEGVVHYHGETLDGTLTVHSTTPGHPPIERSVPMSGHYLGPCDSK